MCNWVCEINGHSTITYNFSCHISRCGVIVLTLIQEPLNHWSLIHSETHYSVKFCRCTKKANAIYLSADYKQITFYYFERLCACMYCS